MSVCVTGSAINGNQSTLTVNGNRLVYQLANYHQSTVTVATVQHIAASESVKFQYTIT